MQAKYIISISNVPKIYEHDLSTLLYQPGACSSCYTNVMCVCMRVWRVFFIQHGIPLLLRIAKAQMMLRKRENQPKSSMMKKHGRKRHGSPHAVEANNRTTAALAHALRSCIHAQVTFSRVFSGALHSDYTRACMRFCSKFQWICTQKTHNVRSDFSFTWWTTGTRARKNGESRWLSRTKRNRKKIFIFLLNEMLSIRGATWFPVHPQRASIHFRHPKNERMSAIRCSICIKTVLWTNEKHMNLCHIVSVSWMHILVMCMCL